MVNHKGFENTNFFLIFTKHDLFIEQYVKGKEEFKIDYSVFPHGEAAEQPIEQLNENDIIAVRTAQQSTFLSLVLCRMSFDGTKITTWLLWKVQRSEASKSKFMRKH